MRPRGYLADEPRSEEVDQKRMADRRVGAGVPPPTPITEIDDEEVAMMTMMTPAIAPPRVLPLSGHRATRYATSMPKKHDDPLYTIARYTTAQAAAMLGITQIAVQTAIKRDLIESELVSPRLRLISQAALDAYRAHHLGQVGQPSRKKRRLKQKAETAKAAAADEASEAPTGTEETHE